MKSILDPTFRYTPSVETDIKKTFARVRREMRQRELEKARSLAEARSKVLPLGPRKSEAGSTH